jgi:adenylate cyclase
MKIKTRRKLVRVLLAALIFVGLWSMVAIILGMPLQRSLPGAFLIGFVYGLYEEFYVQSRYSFWIRRYSAIFEMLFNVAVVVVLMLLMVNLNHLTQARYDQIGVAYARMPVALPLMIVFATLMVTLLRVIGYIGGNNLFHLVTGRYRRPVIENRVFMFLDMKDSTSLVTRLGALKTRELIGKLFYDISQPITDHGGDIYRYTGDGLVATWTYHDDQNLGFLVDVVDDVIQAVTDQSEHYLRHFDHQPQFRVGMHCGGIVISEEGDLKRAIGYYGETIHIAARLEQEAKSSNRDVLLSAKLAAQMPDHRQRLKLIGYTRLQGIREPVEIYELDLNRDAKV